MTIEKLTDEERAWLARYTPATKALRIIDQLSEALAAAAVGERQRDPELAALRERVATEEGARARSETLLQKVGARNECLHRAAHAACCVWESTENHSLHDIKRATSTLRKVLGAPNDCPPPFIVTAADMAVLELQEKVLHELADGGFADKRTNREAWTQALRQARLLRAIEHAVDDSPFSLDKRLVDAELARREQKK